MRKYSNCMAVTPESCSATCLNNLTACLREAQSESSSSQDQPADTSSGAARDSADSLRGVEALNLTQWAQAEPLQCNRTEMKRCREEYAGCQNTVSQQRTNLLTSTAGLEGAPGSSANAGGECSTASCLQGFVRCMRVTACPDYSQVGADGMG